MIKSTELFGTVSDTMLWLVTRKNSRPMTGIASFRKQAGTSSSVILIWLGIPVMTVRTRGSRRERS